MRVWPGGSLFTSLTRSLCCLLAIHIVTIPTDTTAATSTSTKTLKRSLRSTVQYEGHTLVDMDSLGNLLESLDSHLENFQKRTCAVGLQSHNCALADMAKLMRTKAYLANGFSPGKRSDTRMTTGQTHKPMPQEIVQEANALQDDVMEQRKIIWRLKHLLHTLRENDQEAEQEPTNQRKRSCRVRLGGHCLTEELNRVATQYYYLKSPDSPGRRRRSIKFHSALSSNRHKLVSFPSSSGADGMDSDVNSQR